MITRLGVQCLMSNNQQLNGLVGCFQHWQSGGYCLEKTLELASSIIALVVALIQFVLLLKFDSYIIWPLKIKHMVYVLMVLTLIANCIHCFLYKHIYWFDIEQMLFNLFFLTIVFYFSLKLFSSMYEPSNRKPRILLGVGYGILVALYFCAMFVGIFVPDPECEQKWFITVRVVGIILALIFVVVGYVHERSQSQRMRLISFETLQSININNPLPNLRLWIMLNLLAQMSNLVQTIVFIAKPSLHCKFDPNNMEINYLVAFIMLIITFYFPICSTLFMFWRPVFKKKDEAPRSRMETLDINLVDLELVSKRPESAR